MNEPATALKHCVECGTETATHGICCRLCHAALLAVITIRADWQPGEYAALGADLRKFSFREFTAQAIDRNAGTAAKLGAVLERLRPLSGRDEISFKSKLFSMLTHDAAELEGYAKMPGGLDRWRRLCHSAIGELAAACRANLATTRP